MTGTLTIRRAGPMLTLQDQGRGGYLAYGLSRGGAADLTALAEGAALLGQSADLAALEMAGFGGDFVSNVDTRISLTGAEMSAAIDGTPVAWNVSHVLPAGAVLSIGAARSGIYGYLHVGGGFVSDPRLGSRATHLSAGIGEVLQSGDTLRIGDDKSGDVGKLLVPADRFGGGEVRVLPSLQTDLFPEDTRTAFEATAFHRDTRGNRMGVKMNFEGPGFLVEGGLSVLSEVIVPGDIQITGDGSPFVLMAECQTTGGYPRIGTVLPCDLALVAQAQPQATLRFRFVTMEEAVEAERRHDANLRALRGQLTALVRDPRDMNDLLSYQLISGAIAGNEED